MNGQEINERKPIGSRGPWSSAHAQKPPAASDGSMVCAVQKRVCTSMTGPSGTPEVREFGHVSRQFPPVSVGRLIAPAPQAAGTHEGLACHATGSGREGPVPGIVVSAGQTQGIMTLCAQACRSLGKDRALLNGEAMISCCHLSVRTPLCLLPVPRPVSVSPLPCSSARAPRLRGSVRGTELASWAVSTLHTEAFLLATLWPLAFPRRGGQSQTPEQLLWLQQLQQDQRIPRLPGPGPDQSSNQSASASPP